MKFKFEAGADVDLLSGEEYDHGIGKVLKMLSRSQRGPNSIDETRQGTTDANGNLPATEIFRVPVGMVVAIHRINVEAEGYTRAAPYTQGYINFSLDAESRHKIFVGLPASGSTVFPATLVDSVSAAKIAKDGQIIIAKGAGLPVNTMIDFNIQILQFETEG